MADNDKLIADALSDIAKALRLLGNGNVERGDLSPGAVEGLAMTIRDSSKEISSAFNEVAHAISELAEAVRHPGESMP